MNNLTERFAPDCFHTQHSGATEYATPVNMASMPRLFRLTAIHHSQLGDRRTQCTASLFHEKAALKVSWIVNQPDLRLKSGDLVSPRWLA